MPIHSGGMTLLTINELREQFPLPRRPSVETIRRLIRKKQLAGRKFGNAWYVSTRSLEHFFEGTPVEPETEGTTGELKL